MVNEARRDSRLSRPKKLDLLKEKLVAPRVEVGSSFADFKKIPLPLEPDAIVQGVLPGRCVVVGAV